MSDKPTHVRPALYTFYYEALKNIAKRYGYNLVLHGSMNRDLDLIAIPWEQHTGDVDRMIEAFAKKLGGMMVVQSDESKNCFPHGRMSYLIFMNRDTYVDPYEKRVDPQYYLDISVMPTIEKE